MTPTNTPIPSAVRSFALSCVLSFGLSSPGIALAKSPADVRATTADAARELAANPWQQVECRQAFVDLLGQLRGAPLLVGTGSSYEITLPVVDVRSEEPVVHPLTTEVTQSPGELLAGIRSSLALQVKDLAAILHVQRPTIYAWVDGRAIPHKANRERLRAVYRLAKQWDRLSPEPLGQALHHMGADGTSLFDLLASSSIQEERVGQRMLSVVQTMKNRAAADAAPKVPTMRELALARGLHQPPSGGENLDVITGKRISQE